MQPEGTYERVVVKAGTSLLTYDSDQPNLEVMSSLVAQMADLHRQGTEILFVSSGAIAAGRGAVEQVKNSSSVPFRQALAAVGHPRLMALYQEMFGTHGITVAQVLLTLHDVGERESMGEKLRDLNVRNTLLSLLELGILPIVNENDVVAVDELAGADFGDNDNLSARVARSIDADLLVILGVVNGLYTADPHEDTTAELIPTIKRFDRSISAIAGGPRDQKGRGGMATKIEAARFATTNGVNVVIAGGMEPEVLANLMQGVRIGTYCPASHSDKISRRKWLRKNISEAGSIVIDEGAATALLGGNHRSLLPVGVTEVLGNFKRGETVAIRNAAKLEIAAGITNYSSVEPAQINGLKSDQIASVLGDHYGDEVIHRNNMVIL